MGTESEQGLDGSSSNHKDSKDIVTSSILLRSASKVFDRMLSTRIVSWRERKDKEIRICAKSAEDVKNMLYFMSCNRLPRDANALNVIQLAHYYEMDRLFWECVELMVDQVSIENFVDTVTMFNK